MPKVKTSKSMKTKKILKRDLSIRRKYKTTYKDIKNILLLLINRYLIIYYLHLTKF